MNDSKEPKDSTESWRLSRFCGDEHDFSPVSKEEYLEFKRIRDAEYEREQQIAAKKRKTE